MTYDYVSPKGKITATLSCLPKDELIALRAENERLREALKPFAKEAEGWSDRAPDDLHPMIDTFDATTGGSEATFSIGDLRAARAALKGNGEGK